MFLIKEIKQDNSICYEKVNMTNDGKVTLKRMVKFPLYQYDYEGFIFFTLYDNEMQIVEDFFNYINYEIRDNPLTTRRQAATALKLFYCYLSIYNLEKESLSLKDIQEMVRFLKGVNVSPTTELPLTIRSNNTVNIYLATIRNYFMFLNIQNDALTQTKTQLSEKIIEGEFILQKRNVSYSSNLKSNKKINEVSPYISPDEFQKLFEIALEAKDETAQILLHLMYGYGLRIGECLGLTIEDIQEVYVDKKLVPIIYIRNRLSDKNFQYAKGHMHVCSPDQYKTSEYISSKQKVIISYYLYEKIINYVENIHGDAISKHNKNYETTCADIVSLRNIPDENHYIFLTKQGKVLSAETWNYTLKKYFKEANIPLDNGRKEKNLNHRLRHGFAMFHARFSEHPVNSLELQKMMRHSSVSSTMIYYNLTDEDKYEIQKEYQNELYEAIPELKGEFNS